nr:fibronectin type III domain-containing protein [Lentzea guizhouensis]
MRRRFVLSFLMLLGLVAVPPPAQAAIDLNALFTAYGNQGGHWTGGDSTVSVPLPDGRVAWLFSDTFLGAVNADHSRPRTAPFIRNSIVVQQGDQLVQTVHGGTAQDPKTLVTGGDPDQFLWIGSAAVQNGSLKALYGRYENAGEGPLGFRRVGTSLVTFALPGLTVASVQDLNRLGKVGWGTAIFTDAGFDYVYGTEDVHGYKFAHVARVAAGNLATPWQYWNGTAWVSDEAQSKRLFSGGGTAFSVIRKDGQIVLVTHDGNVGFSPWFVAYTASGPTGPFAGPSYLYKAPEPDGLKFAYDAQLHQEQADPGELVLSYNVNSLDEEASYRDARIYRPRFVDVTWPRPAQTGPAAPTGVAVALTTDGTGRVSWTAPGGQSFWLYQRDVTAGQTHFSRGHNTVGTPYQDVSGLKNGHTYEFRVSAVGSGGEGVFSTTVSATAQVTPPPAPTDLRATPGTDADVKLKWNAIPGSATVQYRLFKRDATAGDTEFTEVWFSNPASTEHTITGLVPGHTFEFRVSARNGGGDSPPSNTVQAAVVAAPPPAPTGLTAVAQGDGSVKLQWSSTGDGHWYWVYQRVVGKEENFTKLEHPVVNGTNATPGWLVKDQVYEFAVSSINRHNVESAKSAPVRATARYDKPGAPTGLTAISQGDGSVKLQWNSTGENHWYWIYQRDVGEEEEFQQLKYPVTTSTTFSPGMLLKDHVYEFKVSAVNTGGEGPMSAVVQATARYTPPPAPTGLTAVAGDGTVALSWNVVPTAWYWVYQRKVGDPGFTRLEYPVTTGSSFTAGFLANGSTYEFKVSATTAGGEGAASAVVSAKPMPPLPPKVTGLTATPTTAGEIKLAWDAQPGVYYWVHQGKAGTPLTKLEVPAAQAQFTATGLAHGQAYEFRIAATNLAGDGPQSDVRGATASYALPSAPTGLRGQAAGDGSVDLQWDSAGPNLFYWAYLRDLDQPGSGVVAAQLPAQRTFMSWPGLVHGHRYEFFVRAENAGGLGSQSGTVQVTALGGLPQPPSGLTATAGNAQVVLNWTASPTADVYYWVYYRNAFGTDGWRKLDLPFSATTATIGSLTNGQTYEFKIAATNWAGDSRATAVVSSRPLPPVPALAALTAIAGNNEVGLGWNAVEHATYFWVEYRTAGSSAGWTRLDLPATTWATTVRPLANGTEYEFRVISGNVAGESAASNVVRARPVPPAPAAPGNLRAVAGTKQVALTWNASPTGSVYYWVYYRPAGHANWYYFTYPASGTSFTATGLLNGFAYEFRVTAANLGGQSPPSNVVSATPFQPLPSAPGNLVATAGDRTATLSWNASSGADHYWVYFKPEGHNDWYYFQNPVYGTNYVATNLLNGFNYSFMVRAANEGGQSAQSNVVTVKPLPPAPIAPSRVDAWAERTTARVFVSWPASPTPGAVYNVEYRNASEDGWWLPLTTTNGTTAEIWRRPAGVVWQIRVKVRNLAGEATSPLGQSASNIWLQDVDSWGNNWSNGGNLLGSNVADAMNTPCYEGRWQTICFGWGANGRPVTYGDYFFFPGGLDAFNRLTQCEAIERLRMRNQYGVVLSELHSHNLPQHERVHSWQSGTYDLFGNYVLDYVKAVNYSMENSPSKTDWEWNAFEIQANLVWGHYRNPPYSGYGGCTY